MHAPDARAEGADAAVSALSIPDVSVIDQQGRPVRFYSDLVKGRVVAINTIFTTCTTICPPMGATFASLQKRLGADAERASLISISIDPATDTPARLKTWAAQFDARPGWTLVTGAKPDVDRLLKALGLFSPSPAEHTPVTLLGNDARGAWTRTYGLTSATKLAGIIGPWLRP
jgi:protein SCO1/2